MLWSFVREQLIFLTYPFISFRNLCWGRRRWYSLPLTLCRSFSYEALPWAFSQDTLLSQYAAKTEHLWMWIWQMPTGSQYISASSELCIFLSFLYTLWRISITCILSLAFKRIFVIFIPAFLCIVLQTESSCCQKWNS